MPDVTVSADVDSMLRSANDAAIRSAIGVGQTDAPTFARLTCSATGPGGITVINSNGSIGGFILSAGAPGVFNAGFAIYDNTLLVNRLYISSSGNVGIGNTSTIEKLDVTGTIRASAGYHSINGYTDASNYDRGVFTFVSNTLRIGTENIGAAYPLARPIDFVTGGVVRMSISGAGAVSAPGSFNAGNYSVTGSAIIALGHNGIAISIGNTSWNTQHEGLMLAFRGTTAAFPGLKRSTVALQTTYLQARLADDSAFTNIQGKLTTDTAYTATVVTPTGFLTLYDSTGTAYRVPCVV